MLMGSPTSNVEAWEGRWKRNKAESHSVSSWSSEQRGGRQQPHEGARGNTETKSLCEETNSSSPNLVSSRVQISFHTALLGLPSSLPHLRVALHVMLVGVQHGYPLMYQNVRDLSGAQLRGVRTEYSHSVSTGKQPGEGKTPAGYYQQQRHTDHRGLSSHLQFGPLEWLSPLLYCTKNGNIWSNNP